jgi:hypothetical protein
MKTECFSKVTVKNILQDSGSFSWLGKGIVVPVLLIKYQAIKVYWGSGGIALRILDLGHRWR